MIFSNTKIVFADDISVINSGLNFLKSKQDSTGKITQGYSNPSQWAAITLTANGIDINTVKNPNASLNDFLLSDHPGNGATATDWENRILAIVATNNNPTDFDGINYLQNLEGFYNNSQLGETYLLNDDIFGLLALVASGSMANQQIKQDTLNFIITHQAANGGFSWSPDTTCQFCDPSADMTAAALQALQAAKDNGLTNPNLDSAINNAKNYLLSNQNPDGGFGYFGFSDADSTSWVIMAFNILGIGSTESSNAKDWLITNQQPDGGFPSYNGSDTTTTSHALIAISGKSWILHIFTPAPPSATSSATPNPFVTPTPVPSPTPTPFPTSSPTPTPSSTSTPTSSPTPVVTSSPTPSPTFTPKIQIVPEISQTSDVTPSPTPQVEILGEKTSYVEPSKGELLVNGFKSNALPIASTFTLFTTFKFIEGRRWKK